MQRLDNLFELGNFQEYLREIANDKKVRKIIKQAKLLTLPFVCFKENKDYAFEFISSFVKDVELEKAKEQYGPLLTVLTQIELKDKSDFREIVNGVMSIFDDQNYKFACNLVYFASVLEDDDIVRTDFIKFLMREGLQMKIEFKFAELGIN